MNLIKYKDEMNGEKDYSYFWTHEFDGIEKVVSEIFDSEEKAIAWAKNLKEKINANKI